jgi:hypothetical protein
VAPRAIRFSQAELAAITRVAHHFSRIDEPQADPKLSLVLRGLEKKMLAALAPPEDKPGIGWRRFAELLKEHLGARLAVPENPTPAWYARISGKLKEQGVTEAQTTTVARWMAGWRRVPVSLDYLAYRMPEMLAQAELRPGAPATQTYSLDDE